MNIEIRKITSNLRGVRYEDSEMLFAIGLQNNPFAKNDVIMREGNKYRIIQIEHRVGYSDFSQCNTINKTILYVTEC